MPPASPHVHVEAAQNHMATTFRFRVSCPAQMRRHAESVLEEAHREVARLENELTEFRSCSPVWALNHSSDSEPVPFTKDAFELLELSLRVRQETGGAFDPFAKGARYRTDLLELDPAARTVTRKDAGLHLGFGAIGKGYALDRVRTVLEREGFGDFLLSAGGSSSVLSGYSAPDRQSWEWYWSWKYAPDGTPLGAPFIHSSGWTVALGVSGLHEKGEHLIDPRDGSRPGGLSSALMACPSAALSDALSTALFVGGLDAVAGLPRMAAAVAELDDSVQWDEGFAKLWGDPTIHGGR